MVTLTTSQTFSAATNPGMPSNNVGPSHAKSVYDHLPLPGNTTVGAVDTDTLRGIFHRLGVADSHHLGRDRLCERYDQLLRKIHNEAGNAAVEKFLEEHRG